MMQHIGRALALAFTLSLAQPATALSLEDFTFQLEAGGTVIFDGFDDLNVVTSTNQSTNIQGISLNRRAFGADFTLLAWRAEFDAHGAVPFLHLDAFQIRNDAAAAKTFALTMALPLAGPFSYEEAINAFVDANANDNNDDFSIQVTASPLFTGTVDGSDVFTMLDPLALTLLDDIDYEVVAQQDIAPGVATELGIRIEFTLSAGDSLSVDGRWQLLPEPAPAVALAAAGALSLALRTGRRAH